ncbi:MAG TPA: glutamine amidotransferase [Polyangiaceae bacterium]|nr:glutamine amidotransferase [Polyangiaceae bacterium]
MNTTWAITEDVDRWGVILAAALLLGAIVLLGYELRAHRQRSWLIFSTGVLAACAVALAVVRPVFVRSRANLVGPRVVVLVDQARRMRLPAVGGSRIQKAQEAVEAIAQRFESARLSVFGFSEGPLEPISLGKRPIEIPTHGARSDLAQALRELASSPGERPRAVIVVGDGRLARPLEDLDDARLRDAVAGLGVPVHSVAVLDSPPSDASIRSVRAAGVAVAHQPLAVTVEVGCDGELSCGRIPVRIRELRDGVAPAELATGVAEIRDGVGTVELEITLDRAGGRVLEVSIVPPSGDLIPENDTRYLTFVVARDRIRLLHLAGRPTYDVRALRRWLKSDESVDVVAFFILRDSEGDDPGASQAELALIHFPVDELFTDHLRSFDAIILQDIDAIRYRLTKYLARLAAYVELGGGLIMVGGPSSFAGGNYAGTPLDSILPVEQPRKDKASDSKSFVPRYTQAGLAAAVTRPIRDLLGLSLPEMAGTNLLGQARPGAIVLWEHPEISVSSEHSMPVLALGEAGDGRTIALSVDSTHRLAFSPMAASVAGRAYGALWDGLLGWLMRDPRYEAARVEVVGECLEDEPDTLLRVTRLPGMQGSVNLTLVPLTPETKAPIVRQLPADAPEPAEVHISGLQAGGYTAKVRIGEAPPSRHDFACERGGSAFADSRPDRPRLEAISRVTNGISVDLPGISRLPLPEATRVSAERQVAPMLPPWVWTLTSAVLLGAHWIARRNSGLP